MRNAEGFTSFTIELRDAKLCQLSSNGDKALERSLNALWQRTNSIVSNAIEHESDKKLSEVSEQSGMTFKDVLLCYCWVGGRGEAVVSKVGVTGHGVGAN